ncbi:MAG: glycosyltransferase family 2 protein [Acidimicrobiia bacterium]|nr:glycosyltransferase family 2 protein [Acidimicrobiia bacterium]
MGELTISAVMPVRDGAPYLREAIDSVLAEPEISELIVVDDGSTDATPEILESYGDRIRAVHQPATCQAAAMNHGVREATGDLVAMQDSDDLWPPGRTRALRAALTGDIEAVFGWIEQFVTPELDDDERSRLQVDTRPQASYLLQTSLIRRDAFWRIGPLDESLSSSANIDWISRARVGGLRTTVVSDIVLRRRVHRSNLGRRLGAQKQDDLLRVVRAHLERHRDSGARP